MATGGHDSRSFSWGRGDTWCRNDYSVSYPNDTQAVVTVSGDVTSGNTYDNASYYRISGYGVTCTVGIDGYGKDDSKSTSSSYDYNNKVASVSDYWTINRTSSNGTLKVYTKYSSYNGASNSGELYQTVSIKAITYHVPNAPSNCKVAYTSDKSITVSWSNGSTSTAYPRSNTIVQRQTDDGSWSQVASLGSSATSWVDTTAALGHKYAYRVCAKGTGGTSSYATSGSVYTTPTAFSSLTLSKPTVSTVGITFADFSKYYDAVELQVSEDSTTWTDVAITGSITDNTYIDSNPPAGSVAYRARMSLTQVSSAASDLVLYSDWCMSDSIMTTQAPNAPAIQALQSVYATGTTIELQWSPNHPDGTAQTKAQVEVTAPDGTATTLDISGDTTAQAIDLDTVGTYKIRVRTYGLYEDWGAWSSYVTVQVADIPVIAITAPTAGEAVEALPYSIAWTITDVSGVSYQQLTITDASGKSYVNAALDTSARSYELTGDIGLNNGVEYAIELYVRNGASLTNTTTSTFSTLWDAPSDPVIEIENDDNLAAHITFVASEEVSGIPPTVNYSLSRVMPDGQTNTLLTGATAGQEFIDRIAPLNTEYTYVVVAYAESGATSSQEYTNTIITNKIAINFDSDASVALFGVYNPDWSRTPSHSVSLFHFMDGSSDGLPMAYTMNELEEEHSYSFVVNLDDYRLFDAASRAYVMGWLRDAYGSVVRAQISISTSRFSPDYWTVNVKGNKVRWEEPSNG